MRSFLPFLRPLTLPLSRKNRMPDRRFVDPKQYITQISMFMILIGSKAMVMCPGWGRIFTAGLTIMGLHFYWSH